MIFFLIRSSSSYKYNVAFWFSLLLILPDPSRLGTFTSASPKLKAWGSGKTLPYRWLTLLAKLRAI